MIIWGAYAFGQNSDRIERESIERDRAICQDGNRRAAAVIAYSDRLLDYFGVVGDDREVLQRLATESLPQEVCPPAP